VEGVMEKVMMIFQVDLDLRSDFQEACESAGQPSASWVLRQFVEGYVEDWKARVAAPQLEDEDV